MEIKCRVCGKYVYSSIYLFHLWDHHKEMKYCASCGQSIQKRFIQENKLVYHLACHEKLSALKEVEAFIPSTPKRLSDQNIQDANARCSFISHPPFHLIKV